ncbi:MAG: TonB-dependent receptor [candidate division KSB1 bacterium]|nr:TonB-dependent receptor [candidate division KSB1 bacterium]MDZ7334196.1 TonB-dependent receptor [candidate division KSB1 bacterium]MDZ7357475.1 TonB-dependent receptor [candidate division KSB1 bacterium]MDZ7400889.1 TonB-dependent receptor [candidate division KSB1 bacterium]
MINYHWHLVMIFVWLICIAAWAGAIPQETLMEIRPDSIQHDSSAIVVDSVTTFHQPPYNSADFILPQRTKTIWQISRAVMNEIFHEDLGDILIYFPGNYLDDRGTPGQRLLFTRHGASAMQTQVLFNGVPLYHPIFGGMDLNLIPPAMIDEIAMDAKLPESWRSTGSEAIFMAPIQYHEDLSYSRVGYHKAPYGYSDVDVIFASKASRKMTLILGGIIKSYEGKTDIFRFEQQNFRGRVMRQLSRRWSMDFFWNSNKLKRNLPNPNFATGSEDYPLTSANEKISRADYGLKIGGHLFGVSEQNFGANLFYSSDRQQLSDKKSTLKWIDLGQYAGVRLDLQRQIGSHQARVGAEVISEWTEADQVEDQRRTSGTLFVHDDWRFSHILDLNLFSNFRYHSEYGGRLLGGLGLCFLPSSRGRFNILARQSMRYPVFFETSAKTNFIGNPGLQPELFQTIELGTEWQMPTSFTFKGGIYYKHADHIIELSPLDSLRATFLNQRSAHSWGIDLQSQWSPFPKWQWSGIVTYSDRVQYNGTPKIWLITQVQYTDSLFQGDLKPNFRLELRYFGPRSNQVMHPFLYRIERGKLDPVLVLNAQALLNFGNLKIFFLLENILDRKYQLTYGYDMNRRTLHYGLRWEFWD